MCFTVGWLVQTLIWLVILCAVVAIFRLVVPYVLAWIGADAGLVMRVVNIVIAAIVIIALLWFLYDLYLCAGPGYRRLQ